MTPTTTLHLRLDEDLLTAFRQASSDIDRNHGDLLREIMQAFVEDRLTIVPTDHQINLYGGTTE